MRIFNRFYTLILALLAVIFVTACAPNYVPFYVAGKVETLAAVRKQQEMNHYLNKFKTKRDKFEAELDAFYLDTLHESAQNGLLTPSGIAYLNKVEAEKRKEFDANEEAALNSLKSNLKFYDDIIELQGMTTASIRKAEQEQAEAFNEMVTELGAYAIQEAQAAAERRKQAIDKIKNDDPVTSPEEPSAEAVEIEANYIGADR